MKSDDVVRRFREVFEADVDAGRERELNSYLRLFRGFEDLVVDEYHRLAGGSAATRIARPETMAELAAAHSPRDDLKSESPSPREQKAESPAAEHSAAEHSAAESPAAAPSAEETQPAHVLDKLVQGDGRHYREEGEIARGGMGAILSVRDETLHRDLAMKVILKSKGGGSVASEGTKPELTPEVDRFLAEAQVTAQLDHPGVVPVHELGVDPNGRLYFTMKRVNGRTLNAVFSMAHRGIDNWTVTRALQLITRVCETLSFAHAKGVIHRDLKPANIMVGDFGEVYVMDWGLAKVLGGREIVGGGADDSVYTARADASGVQSASYETMAGAVLGTPAYMPPEQAGGQLEDLDARSDVYAIGAILYHLLVGHAPYGGPDGPRKAMEILRAVLQGPPTPIAELTPDLPGEIVAIAEKAMAREHAQRYESAEELAQDLRDYIEGRVVRAYRTGALVELKKWVLRNRGLAAAICVVFVLLAVGLVVTRSLLLEARENRDEALRQNYRLAMTMAADSLVAHAPSTARKWLHDETPIDQRGTWEWRHLDARLDETFTRVPGDHPQFTNESELLVISKNGDVVSHALPDPTPTVVWPASRGRALRLTRDGSHVVVERPRDPPALAALFERSSGERVLDLVLDHSQYYKVFDDARHVVVADESTLSVHDLQEREELASIDSERPHFLRAGRGASQRFVSGWLEEAVIWLHDRDSLERTDVLGRHDDTLIGLDLSWDDRFAVSTAYDDTVRFWDMDDPGEPTLIYECPDEVPAHSVAISPDGARIALGLGDRTVRFVSAQDATELVALNDLGVSYDAVFSPDGRWVATEIGSSPTVSVWAADSADDPRVLEGHQSFVYGVTISADGRRIASCGWDGYAGHRGSVRIWDAASGEPIAALCHDKEYVTSLRYARVGDREVLVGAGMEHGEPAVRVWDAATGESIHLDWPAGFGTALDVSPDGTHVVITSDPTGAAAVQLDPFEVLPRVGHHACQGAGLGFVSDDRYLSLRDLETIELVDARTGAARSRAANAGRQVWAIAVSPDGSVVATSGDDDAVTIWDAETLDVVAQLRGHGGSSLSVAFSPDGRRLVSGGRDGLIHVWDAERYVEVAALAGHDAYVKDLEFSADGEMLVSGSGDGTLRIWETRPLGDRLRDRHERRRLVKDLAPRVRALLDGSADPAAVVARLSAESPLDDRASEIAAQIVLAELVRRRTEGTEDR